MLTEKDMEDAIANDPGRYLGEAGLKLISRQYHIGSYVFDLLFEDRHGGRLIVELQRGTLDRGHTYKIFDYYDEYKSRHPREFVDLMVVANQIPTERKQRLTDRGVTFREIPVSEFPEPLPSQSHLTPTLKKVTLETSHSAEISSINGDDLTSTVNYTDFWNGLLEKCNKRTHLFQRARPSKKPYLHRQVEGLLLVFVALRNEAWVELCIQKSPKESEAMMQDFERAKAEIERRFGEPLRWERPPGRNRRKIMSQPIRLGMDNKERWGELQSALVEHMLRFAVALGGHGSFPNNL